MTIDGVLALANCELHTGEEVLDGRAVLVADGAVADVVAAGDAPAGARMVDLGGATLAPGFVDLQVNGGGDRLLNDDPTPETIEAILRAHRRFGTTAMLPTFITGPDAEMARAVEAVRACLDAGTAGVLGIHLEGPFLNPKRAGVHDPGPMRPMGRSEVALIPELPNGAVLVTLAPEVVEEGVIAELVRRGAKVSAGHTEASGERMRRAFDEGLDCGTHLFNAMRGPEGREDGALGALLEDGRAWCGLIADGFHVPPASLRRAWRAKRSGPGRAFLVTDAMPPVGGRRRRFRLGAHLVEARGGRCQTAAGVLAGSALDMASAVRYAVAEAGIPKAEALRMASLHPAAYLGLDGRHGRIAPGLPADLVVLDEELRARQAFVGGAPARG